MKGCELLLLPHLGVTPDPESLRVSMVPSSTLMLYPFCTRVGLRVGMQDTAKAVLGSNHSRAERRVEKLTYLSWGTLRCVNKLNKKCFLLFCSYWYFWKLISCQC